MHDGSPNLVKSTDVLFSVHATLCCFITLCQFFIYPKQRDLMSIMALTLISFVIITTILFCIITVFLSHTSLIFTWLNALYYISLMKLGTTLVKYVPQVYLNHKRKSTRGWNIYNVNR
eukprot:UN01405